MSSPDSNLTPPDRSAAVSPEGTRWDECLTSSLMGHYEQSTCWEDLKRAEGWSCHRSIVDSPEGRAIGGFQVFWRKSGPGRIGYVSRGPVVFEPSDARSTDQVVSALFRTVAHLKLNAMVCQVPENDKAAHAGLVARGSKPFLPGKVAGATLLVDLSGDEAKLIAGALPTTRKKLRQALSRGLAFTIYKGQEPGFLEEILPDFFRLMCITCQRQGASPNPPNIEMMKLMWAPFAARGLARLVMVSFEGKAIAGLLSFGFGKRFTLLKKGWDGSHGDKRPNELATFISLKVGQEEGYDWADFGDCDRRMAERLLGGEEPSEAEQRTRYFFNYAFGAQPRLLPEAQIVIPNPLMRLGYGFYRAYWIRRHRKPETAGGE